MVLMGWRDISVYSTLKLRLITRRLGHPIEFHSITVLACYRSSVAAIGRDFECCILKIETVDVN
jgi:hypothetical protein